MTRHVVDVEPATVEDLLAMGIELETCAEHVYEEFARMFDHLPEVAAFWRLLAADEVAHRDRLSEVRSALSAARLSRPADASLLREAAKLLAMNTEERLGDVRDLDDAFEMANELECSETNTVFRFFLAEFAQDTQVLTDLMEDLDEHVERLTRAFPSEYTTRTKRTAVKAIHA